jgi:hypothetical protein
MFFRNKLIVFITLISLCSCSIQKLAVKRINKVASIEKTHWFADFETIEKTPFHASVNNIFIKEKSILKLENSLNKMDNDSIKITTKTGRKYIGIISKKDEDGYFIKINNSHVIFINHDEIRSIKFLNNKNILQNLEDSLQENKNVVQNLEDFSLVNKNQISNPNDVDDFYGDKYKKSADSENQQTIKKIEPMSLWSFICGLLGYVPVPLIGGLGWIAAIILSKAGMRKIDEHPEKFKGRGLAIAGKTLGIIGITLALIALILILVFLAVFL